MKRHMNFVTSKLVKDNLISQRWHVLLFTYKCLFSVPFNTVKRTQSVSESIWKRLTLPAELLEYFVGMTFLVGIPVLKCSSFK